MNIDGFEWLGRGALQAIGENAGHIKQGLAKLVLQHRGDA